MKQTLRVGGVPEHFNLPWRLAIDKNAFAKQRLDVAYSEFPGGTGDMTRALREGELDMAIVLTEGAVADALVNDVNRLVKVYVDSPLIWGIHVAAESSIRRIAEIRGKSYAISRYGSGSHLIAIVDAAGRGWSGADIPFVVAGDLAGARRALASGKADVFLWERFMTQPLVDSGEFRRVGQRIVPWPAFVVTVRRELLPRRVDSIRGVLETVDREAKNFMRRKGAVDLIADTYGLARTDSAKWFSKVHWSTGFRVPRVALERVISALSEQQVLKNSGADPEAVWFQL